MKATWHRKRIYKLIQSFVVCSCASCRFKSVRKTTKIKINSQVHDNEILKFRTSHLSVLPFNAKIHQMVVRIANREYPDQTASSEAV